MLDRVWVSQLVAEVGGGSVQDQKSSKLLYYLTKNRPPKNRVRVLDRVCVSQLRGVMPLGACQVVG